MPMNTATWRLAGGATPIFRGMPPLLLADLDVHNLTGRRIRLGAVDARLAHSERRYRVRMPGRLEPDARAHVRARLRVECSIPPGTHQATIRVGDQDQPIELRVLESPVVVATPAILRVAGASGDVVEASLFLESRGNVAFTIQSARPVFFEETDWVGRALVDALRESDQKDGFQRYLDRFFHELRATMAHTTTVEISAPVRSLAPGAVVEVQLVMTLPAGLHKGRTYAAFLDICGARLNLELACNGSIGSNVRRRR
jgi:hypothetical protein